MNRDHLRTWLVPLLVIVNLLVILLLFPFGSGYITLTKPLGADLWITWTKTTPGALDFTYCLLVPPIVVYLIFLKRHEINQAKVEGRNAAIGWILLGLIIFWVGSKAGKQLIGEAGLQFVLMGTALWFWGKGVFRKLFFPWIFLIFAWPLPFMDSLVAFPLRMIVTFLSFHLLNLIGIPCQRIGTAIISAPDQLTGLAAGARFQIDIADPCSGIHSLLPLMMFSALYGYFFLQRRWQQWTIFLSVLPLSILGNVVRILLLVTGCIHFGTSFALGTNETPSWFHEGCGYAVFVVALGLELLLARLLIAWEAHGSARTSSTPAKDQALPIASDDLIAVKVPLWRSGVLLGLAGVMLLIYAVTPDHYLLGEEGVIMNLPDQVTVPVLNNATFTGSPAPIFDAERLLLPKDTQFARKNYNDGNGHQIYFSVILGGMQGGLQQFSLHRPEICLPAQGWTIDQEKDERIRLVSGHDLAVRSILIERNQPDELGENHPLRAIYMFWFVAAHMTTPSYLNLTLWSGLDRFLHNRNSHWASLTVMTPIIPSQQDDGLNEETTRNVLRDFIRQIVPFVQKSEAPEYGSN